MGRTARKTEDPAAGQPHPATAPDIGPQVVVVGPAAGRRRAGRAFGPEPVSIPLDELGEDDLAALQGDPLLIVSFPIP